MRRSLHIQQRARSEARRRSPGNMGGLLDAIKDGDLDAAADAVAASPQSMSEEDPETWLSPLHHCATAGAVAGAYTRPPFSST